MNAEIQYLNEIANAIKNISKSGIAGGGSISISSGGNVNIDAVGFRQIADKIASGLIATLTEENDGQTTETKLSIIDVVRDAVNEALHDANFITVEEEQDGQTVEVEKSIFELIKDDLAAL